MPAYEKATWSEVQQVHGPRSGTRALHDVLIESYFGRGARSGGMYNRRRVRGGTAWSLHAAGRAGDIMVPVKSKLGDEIFHRLIAAADACGVCEVIWNRQRWDGTTKEVRPYRGVNPHEDHVHFGQTVDIASRPDTPDLRKWFRAFLFR